MRALLIKLSRFWAVRGLAVGAIATVADLAVLLTCVELLGLPRVPSVSAGVAVGGVVGFLLNRTFVFQAGGSNVVSQALKYGMLVCCELGVHTALNTALVHGLGVHYLGAKFACDFVVFTCLHLFALRYLVFAGKKGTGYFFASGPVSLGWKK
jgi:putative flippase GtrA